MATERDVACTGKSWWYTKADAKREASRLRRTGHTGMRAYQCKYCPHAHIGGRPGHASYLRQTRTGPVPLHQYIQERT